MIVFSLFTGIAAKVLRLPQDLIDRSVGWSLLYVAGAFAVCLPAGALLWRYVPWAIGER